MRRIVANLVRSGPTASMYPLLSPVYVLAGRVPVVLPVYGRHNVRPTATPQHILDIFCLAVRYHTHRNDILLSGTSFSQLFSISRRPSVFSGALRERLRRAPPPPRHPGGGGWSRLRRNWFRIRQTSTTLVRCSIILATDAGSAYEVSHLIIWSLPVLSPRKIANDREDE